MENSIVEKNKDLKWLDPEAFFKLERLNYIKSFNKGCSSRCPECNGELISSIDEDETICETCGLVVSASSYYVAGIRIALPYGLNLYRK